MFVILAAKSLFIFLFLRLLVLGVDFGTSVSASAILTATHPILDNLATLATIPTSCNNTCNAIQATIIDCTTVECVCTPSNTASLDTCVDCLQAVEPNNQTVIAMAQNILNQYVGLCDAGGISVPIQTASGFTGSVVLPTTTAASFPASQSTISGTETGGEPPQSSQSTTAMLTSQGISVSSSTLVQTSGISEPVSSSIATAVSSAASSTALLTSSAASQSSSAAPSTTTVASNSGHRMFGESFTGSGVFAGSLLFGILVSWAP